MWATTLRWHSFGPFRFPTTGDVFTTKHHHWFTLLLNSHSLTSKSGFFVNYYRCLISDDLKQSFGHQRPLIHRLSTLLALTHLTTLVCFPNINQTVENFLIGKDGLKWTKWTKFFINTRKFEVFRLANMQCQVEAPAALNNFLKSGMIKFPRKGFFPPFFSYCRFHVLITIKDMLSLREDYLGWRDKLQWRNPL